MSDLESERPTVLHSTAGMQVEQNTIDEVIRSGQELVEMVLDHFPGDKYRSIRYAAIGHRVMLRELAGEL